MLTQVNPYRGASDSDPVHTSEVIVNALAVDAEVNVPDNSLTTIVTYTAVADTRLSKIVVSGTDYAKFEVFKNAVLIETRRTGPERNLDFGFDNPLMLQAGDVLDVKVTHYNTGVLADFESTVYGY